MPQAYGNVDLEYSLWLLLIGLLGLMIKFRRFKIALQKVAEIIFPGKVYAYYVQSQGSNHFH